jgi:outer membrane protein assembly factor BamE (lipoprotein component of BamABCDE complex)
MARGRTIAALALGLALLLTACGQAPRTHGYVPDDRQLEAVVVGRDTRATVQTILGNPGSTGLLADEGWFYVRSTFEDGNLRELREVDREVVAVSFDEAGVVTNVERFGLDDGQVVLLSRRVTSDNRAGVGFLRQLFGNLGRIDPAQFFE